MRTNVTGARGAQCSGLSRICRCATVASPRVARSETIKWCLDHLFSRPSFAKVAMTVGPTTERAGRGGGRPAGQVFPREAVFRSSPGRLERLSNRSDDRRRLCALLQRRRRASRASRCRRAQRNSEGWKAAKLQWAQSWSQWSRRQAYNENPFDFGGIECQRVWQASGSHPEESRREARRQEVTNQQQYGIVCGALHQRCGRLPLTRRVARNAPQSRQRHPSRNRAGNSGCDFGDQQPL